MTLVLYLLFIAGLSFTGFVLINNLFRGKINFFENLGLALSIGLMLNFVVVASLSAVHVAITPFLMLFPLLALMGVVYFWDRKLKRAFIEINVEKIKVNWLTVVVVLILGAVFFAMFFRVMSSGFTSWDEFSYWGKAARMTFVDKNVFINKVVTVEGSGQPVFWPASTGSMAIFAGGFVENYVKLLTFSMYLFFVTYLFGFLDRFDIKLNEKLLFLLLFVSSSQALLQYATYLHADIPLMCFYSAGTILVFLGIYKQNSKNDLFWLGIALLSAVIFIKRGGAVLSLISLFSLAFVSYRAIFKNGNWKRYLSASLFLVVLQALLLLASKALGEMASPFNISKPFEFFNYGLTHFSEMTYSMVAVLNNHYNFTAIWFLSFGAIIFGSIVFRKKIFIAVATLVFLNVAYLTVAYLVMFSQIEIVTSASFERYVLAFLPICFTTVVALYIEIKLRSGSKELIS